VAGFKLVIELDGGGPSSPVGMLLARPLQATNNDPRCRRQTPQP
jgi:hypothetical protein